MKRTLLMAGCVLTAAAMPMAAQQMSMPCMPGMDMSQPKQIEHKPTDMQSMGHDTHDRRAQQNAASEKNSVAQQQVQRGVQANDHSDQTSIHIPIQQVQEPEALDFRTGSDLPAPELLGDVVQREPMTLEQFLALADAANPTLAEAQRNVDRSNAQAQQTGLLPNPTVGYSGDHIRGGEYHGGEQGAFFSQQFVMGGKLALRREIDRAQGRANVLEVEVQRARVHNDVAQAFFDALAAQQSVVIHDRLLKVALDADTNSHELSRVGQEDAANILTAEVATEQARVDFYTAQQMFLAAYAKLATLAGQHALAVHPLRGELTVPPAFDAEEYVRRDVEESPLVKRAQADVAVGEARLKDAKRERVPDLNVTAGEWYSGEEVMNGLKAGWESFAQAGVQVPLWNRNQGNVDASKALLDRAQQDVERTKLWTRNQAEPLARQYDAARFTAERYRTQMIPRARRAYELEVMKYQQMSESYPPVLAAQKLLFSLQLGYSDALNQQWHAAIALENYALMNGLDAPAASGEDSTTINLPTGAGSN